MNTNHHLLELAHVHAGEVIAEAGVDAVARARFKEE